MLQIDILCVGKLKEKYLSDAVADYAKRLGRYCRLNIIEVPDEAAPERASEAQQEQIKQKEGARLLSRLDDRTYAVVLAIEGTSLDSPQIASFLSERALYGDSHLAFIIGGSLGLSSEVYKRANARWSFSRLTFPHGIVRLLLAEQIYRGFRILSNEPYHK